MKTASIETVAHPHLRKLLDDLNTVTAEVERLRATLSEAQCIWKPEPDVWNVLECFRHLITTDELYFPNLRAAIEKAPREGSSAPYRPSFFGKTFIRYVSPESTRKIKTFRMFEPPPALTDVAVFQQFIDHQDELAALIRQADGIDLNRNKLSSPASRFVRFSAGEGLTLLVAHQRRHLQQAQRLTEHPDFSR